MHYDIYLLSAPANREMAAALAEGMRKYKMPKGVVPGNSLDSHSVFLDCENSPMTEETERMLREAGYLIVLFSPDAVASESLMEKLYYFEKDTGRENIVPVIAEGEPVDIFPPMFIQHRKVQHILPDLSVVEMDETIEPVAADIRGNTPKRRKEAMSYETVRITASVLDLHPDALEQRHRRRRKQRIITLAAFLGAVLTCIAAIFGVLGVKAHKEGVIAQKQTQITVQAADRLASELPQMFSEEPEALEILQDALEETEEQLARNGLERFLDEEA